MSIPCHNTNNICLNIFAGPRCYLHNPANRCKPRISGGCAIWQQWAHDWHHGTAGNRSFFSYHNLHPSVKHPTARWKQECLCAVILLRPSYARWSIHYHLCSWDISSAGATTSPGTTTGFNRTGIHYNESIHG